jgi:hypothetical protein
MAFFIQVYSISKQPLLSKQALLVKILAFEFRIQIQTRDPVLFAQGKQFSLGFHNIVMVLGVVSIPELGFERKHYDGQLSVVFIQHTLEIQEIIFVIEPWSVLPCYMEVHGVVPSDEESQGVTASTNSFD